MTSTRRLWLLASLTSLALIAGGCGGSDSATKTYALSGTVTGPWVEGITVTLGGAATRTTTTSVTGTFSFTGLSDGSYTVTPSLDGYTYGAVPAAVAISGADATQDFTASSAVTSYSVSGTVTYTGAKTGRIYVRAYSTGCTGGCSPVGGRSLAVPGTFTIRGLPAGNYSLEARMDVGGYGARNASDPVGSNGPFAVSANVTGRTIAVADPTPPTATVPTGLAAQPSSGSMLVLWDTDSVAGGEVATDYQISWGTDTGATNGAVVTVPARDDAHYFQSGLTDATPYYYKIRSRVGTTVSAYSSVVGPIPAGAIGTDYSISGAVTFTGTATGPLYVGIYSETSGTFRFARSPLPVASPKAFTITGVPAGTYFLFGIVDQNNSGTIDLGDINNTGGGSSNYVTVTTANLTGQDFTVSGAAATAVTTTQHVSPASGSSFYQVDNRVSNGAKQLVGVTMISGKNVRVPADLGRDWEFAAWSNWSATAPTVGDTYTFKVRYSDDTTATLTSSVTAVLNSFAQGLTAAATGTPGVPLFSWTAPAAPPVSYGYGVQVWGSDANWWYPNSSQPLPSSTLSVVYDVDGGASAASLTSGNTYTWGVSVEDALGNRATKQATYLVP